jgi:hypothetical protein
VKSTIEPSEKETSSTIKTTLNDETARHKMIFLALLSGVMEYRAQFIDKDLEANMVLCESMAEAMINDPKKKVNTPGKKKRVEQKSMHMHYDYKKKVERFDKVCTEEIAAVSQEFKIPDSEDFKAYCAGMGVIFEQYLNAKNTGDLISVCKAYNSGLLDELLNTLRAEQVEEKKEFFDKVEGLEKPDKP